MKKIFVSLFACAALLSSCNMDTEQPGVFDDKDAINSVENARYFRNYLYNNLRSMSVGGYVYNTEIQCDQFVGLSTAGGRGGTMNYGDLTSSTGEFASVYGGMYSRIANVNYFLMHVEPMLESFKATPELEAENSDNIAQLERYIGEAKFVRGYAYWYLFDHYCMTYDKAIGDEPAKGLQLTTTYFPTGVNTYYPGRSTMNESLKLINDDLAAAYNALKKYEDDGNVENCVAGAPYLSSYAVLALQARIALATGDYNTAITKAQDVIANSGYSLASGQNVAKMWQDSYTEELIFAPYVDVMEAEGISSTCVGWNYWWSKSTQSDLIPLQPVLELYAVEGLKMAQDYRFGAYFSRRPINGNEGKVNAYVFNKYPGNASLVPSGTTNMYLNKPKPFRLGEQYLILAEAAALATPQQTKVAQDAVNALRKARVQPNFYKEINYTGDELIKFVQDERSRELIGEGFRCSDLRRWKKAWSRNYPYTLLPNVDSSFALSSTSVSYSADDYRYVWAIPSAEMNVNPNIAGQQNTGY